VLDQAPDFIVDRPGRPKVPANILSGQLHADLKMSDVVVGCQGLYGFRHDNAILARDGRPVKRPKQLLSALSEVAAEGLVDK
jgi:hypothetical protein